MAKFKRKGKTFVSEHYVDQDKLPSFVAAIVKYIEWRRSKDEQGFFLSYLQRATEISIWADPRGLYITGGMSLPKTPIPWTELKLDRDKVDDLLITMYDVFLEHGQDCGDSYHFKILLNENTFAKIADIYKI